MYIDRILLPNISDKYSNIYPANIIYDLGRIELPIKSNITLLYGSNGSGKSTLLNLIANKLECDKKQAVDPKTEYNYFEGRIVDIFNEVADNISFSYKWNGWDEDELTCAKRLITSSEVLNYVSKKIEYNKKVSYALEDTWKFVDGFEWRERDGSIAEGTAIVKRLTERDYCYKVSKKEKAIYSNGEEVLDYFEKALEVEGIYLLDEPENCLSTVFQKRLADYIYDLSQNYNCQFIIASHSPFFLSIKGTQIINIDESPAEYCDDWRTLENMQPYFELFHKDYRGGK